MRRPRLAILIISILSCVCAGTGFVALYGASDGGEFRRLSIHALWAIAYALLPLVVVVRWSIVSRLASTVARIGLLSVLALDVVWLATGVWAASNTSMRLRLSLLAFSAALVCHSASLILVYRAAIVVNYWAEHEHDRTTP